ncbi:MAG: alkaline phosphatase [Nitrospirae bacterium]|nr:alkaline phosphatase [Nitrospirota bacterium]
MNARKESRSLRLSLRIAIYLFASLSLIIANGIYGTVNTFSQEKPAATVAPSTFPVTISTSWYTSSPQRKPYPLLPPSKVKNVILLIGDGLGISERAAARIRALGAKGKLYMDRMPVTGLITTYSANELITDSAAAGTALATGYKTNNKMIGMNPEEKNLTSILGEANKRGLATGLVVTDVITGATPAAFASHVNYRYKQEKIAPQLLENKVNILLGGGKRDFLPSSSPGGKRKDARNLIDEAKRKGYLFVQTREELEKANSDYLLGLFELGPLTTNPPEPSLAEMAGKAISLLSRNKKGFFLMIEGSQIDWAGHANDIDNNIKQTLLFDEAVKVAIDFALKDKHTLVIVTADHETGGLEIIGGSLDGANLRVSWATKGHTPPPVPLSAFGPQAEKFMGFHDNTDVPGIIAKVLRITPFPPESK